MCAVRTVLVFGARVAYATREKNLRAMRFAYFRLRGLNVLNSILGTHMEKFLQDILSGYWWVSVVVVGVLINLASAYLKPFLEGRLARISGYWRTKREAEVELFNRQVSLLKGSADLRSVYALRENRYRLQSITFLVFSVLSFLLILLGGIWVIPIIGKYSLTAGGISGLISFLFFLDEQHQADQVKKLVESSIEGIGEFKP